MDLIYYYPRRADAPSNVARNVFKYLMKREKELPFENIKLFTSPKYVEWVQRQFDNFKVITYKDLNRESKNCMIHIPVSPLIYPNSKFLLHLFAIFKRRKLILQEHGDARTEIRIKWKTNLNVFYVPAYIFQPYLLKSADRLIVHSYRISNLARSKYGVKNIVVIPNGIEDFWFDESDKTNIELDGDPNLFYHGRLSSEKGVDSLIKGFAKTIKGHPKMKLYISGVGPQQRQLERLTMELGIEKNVVFLGFVKQLKTYLEVVDGAIYPSRYEPFSLAILEAFSSMNGPVYYSNLAGINDFVVRDGYNLNAFDPTVENISKIIKEIIEGNYDVQVVRQQKEFARQYVWHRVIDQYIKLYNNFVT